MSDELDSLITGICIGVPIGAVILLAYLAWVER